MISIGFDDEPNNNGNGESDEEIKLKHGKNFDKEQELKSVYLSPRRLEQFKEQFDCVVVHDYGDEYHLSEKERENKNKFYNLFRVLKKSRKKLRKIDEFVSVYRDALKCLDAVAESNGVYDPEEFKKKVLKGKITVTGLTFPKYTGRDKKEISWEYLTEFILSDKDPEELLDNKNDEILSEEELEDLKYKLFDEEELKEIFKPISKEERQKQLEVFDVDEDSQDDRNVVVFLDKNQTKNIIKHQPELISEIREMKRGMKSSEHLKSYVQELTEDDFEEIGRYDQKHNIVTTSEMPVFKGDLMNDKDYEKYLAELNEYEENCIRINYNGHMKTQAEIDRIELKAVLEQSGWNIRNLYDNREKQKKMNKAFKKDKEREKKLKKQLLQVQKRTRTLGKSSKSSKKKKSKKGDD